jgi:methyl-accepting chemotaxis protein
MKNLKVAHKLGLGFGAIVILTIVVALMAVSSLNMLSSRSEKALTAAYLSDQANEIRAARAQFAATGDASLVARVQELARAINQRVAETKSTFSEPENIRNLEQTASQALEYQRSFEQLVEARERKINTRRTWLVAGDTADRVIGELELEFNGTPQDPVLHFDETEAETALLVADAARQTRLLRYHVRGYLMDESERMLQILVGHMDVVRAASRALEGKLSGNHADRFNEYRQNSEQYMNLLLTFPPIRVREVLVAFGIPVRWMMSYGIRPRFGAALILRQQECPVCTIHRAICAQTHPSLRLRRLNSAGRISPAISPAPAIPPP